ncbi:hypothetical protein [Geminicoccus harenae]|uniref:hypothetical protein n=1 Tax=Geminicoccus harenae TaxID=2498453 RepID=UPI00168BC590|nr:hypothetical protein [Geminicoccus harenae]
MAEAGVYPRFYKRAVQNNRRTAEEGRPIFEEREYVEIIIAGDKGTVVDRPVRDDDKQRFGAEYQAFLQGQDAPLVGTPIEQWPLLNKSQVAELKGIHVMTVEALAALSDSQLQKLGPGGRSLKSKAETWLQAAAGTAPLVELQEEVDRLRADNDMLKGQIKDLGSVDPKKVEQLQAENQSLKAQVESLTDANKDLEKDLKRAQTKIGRLEDDLEQATKPAPNKKAAG